MCKHWQHASHLSVQGGCITIYNNPVQLQALCLIAHSAPIDEYPFLYGLRIGLHMSKEKQQQKKFKSNWFRIATAGDTSDGRQIEASWITQMAKNYNPKTYGARIWNEHMRSMMPDGPFGAYGDVLALKTEKVTINGEEKDALFAQIEPTDALIVLNKKKQKIYTSIEVSEKFANTGEAYLVGLAVTDSPASLGTDMLQFAAGAANNPLASRKQHKDNLFTAACEASIQFEEVKEVKSFSAGLVDKVKKMFKVEEEPEQDQFSDSEQAILAIAQETAEQGEAVTNLGNDFNELKAQHEQLQTSFNDLKNQLENTPDSSQRRPVAGNSNFSEEVDC